MAGELYEGAPTWPLRRAKQLHTRFVRKPVALLRVARNTAADDVFPHSLPPTVARQNVINIQVRPVEFLVTVLTGVVVALENVVAGELHLFLGEAIKEEQNNDSRDPDPDRNGADHFRLWLNLRHLMPAVEIMRQEVAAVILSDDLSVTLIKQRECASDAACVHSLPESVENQYLPVQECFHHRDPEFSGWA